MTILELYQLFLHHPQVTTDSRHCPPGSLFFALKGDTFDGNQYAAKALASGSAYAIIDNPVYAESSRFIVVDNALHTLQQLASHHRKALATPIIGITGTNGKTTTKELLAAILSTRYRLLYTEGNFNNHIGVPLTLLRLTAEHQLAVVEMGASRPGDIRELAEIACPNYGIITNVGRAHLEGFGSFEGVVQTKGELYQYIRAMKGQIFIQHENATLQAIATGIPQTSYGEGEASFVSGQATSCSPYLSFHWCKKGEEQHTVHTHLIGAYNLDNVLAAVAVGCYFGLSAEQIGHSLSHYEPTNHRSQLKKTEHNTLLIDAYNANPSSMKAALENFSAMPVHPKALILGDMRELGATSPALHAEVVAQIAQGGFDKVFLCGEQFAGVGEPFETFASAEALIERLQSEPLVGYYILIKGSHGMALERTIPYLS